MKSIIESLNALADKIDTEGVSDVKPDYKNPNYSIVKALTRIADVFDADGSSEVVPEYKNPNNSIETALKRIADNYSAGSGGANLKTLNLVNNTNRNIVFSNCIVDGYFNEMIVRSGETAAVQYVTPTAVVGENPIMYTISILESLGEHITVDTPAGIDYVTDFPPAGLYISNAAADGATVTFTGGMQ